MKIEKVEPSKHRQERVLVFLEGGDLLRVTQNELLRFGLCAGMELSAETLEALKKSGETSSARVRGANLLGRRPYSRHDLAKKLREKGADEDAVSDAVEYLTDLGALDDVQYGRMLVRHYSTMGYGAGRLRAELSRHGVDRALWDEIFTAMPQSEEALQKVILSRTHGKAPNEAERKKLFALLLRRGFSRDDVNRALCAYGESIEEENI